MLICDKRRPARARGYQYQAPPRGPNKDSPPGLRPAPRALLRVGRHAPRPPGLRPLVRLRAPGPCCLGHPAGGVPGTGAPGGRGGQPLAVVHAGRPAPGGFRASGEIQKVGRADARRGVPGGVPPGVVERWVSRRWPVGGQGAAAGCARRPRAIGLSTAERATGQRL